jgi:ADP-ribose pyrophosphatase
MLASFLAGVMVTKHLATNRLVNDDNSSSCQISLGAYKGSVYTTTSTLETPICLVESKFMKVSRHTVRFAEHDKVLSDWLWIDYHDRINVLVQTGADRFLIFRQTKYALEGRESLAIVGGIIEPGETPQNAAHREVLEETKYDCRDMKLLGRYRTDVNRGMGWTHTFLARDCHEKTTTFFRKLSFTTADAAASKTTIEEEEVGVVDTERQDVVFMGQEQIRKALKNGKFMEIQWSATVALALLSMEDSDSHQR